MPPLRSRRAWIVLLAAGALCALLARASFLPSWPAGPWPEASAAGTGGESGAARELARARREQALIRAEVTHELLRALDARAPRAGGGS